MTVRHSRVSTAVPVRTWSPVTAVPVRQRSPVAPAPRRTAALTTRVITTGRVTAPGSVTVLPASEAPTAPPICANWSRVITEDPV